VTAPMTSIFIVWASKFASIIYVINVDIYLDLFCKVQNPVLDFLFNPFYRLTYIVGMVLEFLFS
jgi:hypothetical protein